MTYDPIDTNEADSTADGEVRVKSISDNGGNKLLDSVSVTGQVTLTSGLAEVSTGISDTDATFILALGVDDPNANTEVAGALYWDDASNNYEVRIREPETSVNPTVNFDIIRVR